MLLPKTKTDWLKKWVELERWTQNRREEFIKEFHDGFFTKEEACERLWMSPEEFESLEEKFNG